MAKRGVFVSTNIQSAPLSFVSAVELENGMLVEMGEIVDEKNQVYNALAPTGTAPVYVVGNPAWSYDGSSIINQNEDEYYIPAGKTFRVYPLVTVGRKDRFAVAAYGITNSDDIDVGDTIGLAAGAFRPAVDGNTDAFEGKVVKVETQSFEFNVGQTVDTRVKLVTIEVQKNSQATA